MKNLTIFIFLSLFLSIKASELHSYHPILEEGKVWIIYNTMREESNKSSFRSKIWIEKDTIFEGEKVFKLAKINLEDDSLIENYYVKENNKQLFFYFDFSKNWLPILDFNCNKGDETIPLTDLPTGYEIDDEGFINIYDITYRYLKILNNYFWIEGIGSPNFNLLTIFPGPTCDYDIPTSRHIEECNINGEIIFRYDEFKRISGIEECSIYKDTLETCFDLLGNPVTSPTSGLIYIRHNKKYVVK